jgi:hypothetical protein
MIMPSRKICFGFLQDLPLAISGSEKENMTRIFFA